MQSAIGTPVHVCRPAHHFLIDNRALLARDGLQEEEAMMHVIGLKLWAEGVGAGNGSYENREVAGSPLL